MKRRVARARGKPVRRSLVLVFGENEHDRKAIRDLAGGLRQDLATSIETRRQPLVLIRGATLPKAKSNARKIADLVRQETAGRDILAVLAHQDCDAVEPAHIAHAKVIEDEINAAGCPAPVIAVTPAWEIEAWWMVFPEAVGKVVEGWRNPDDWLGRDVGQVRDAKEALAKAVQPKDPGRSAPREYSEADSIAIAGNIVKDGLLPSFVDGKRTTHQGRGAARHTRSASFESFRQKVLAIRARNAA